MTILVAYAPRPEGQAALDKGIEIDTPQRAADGGQRHAGRWRRRLHGQRP